ncbi:hypothetical protein [Streptomyces sp. NPDC093795]|uniref:hypothetical protein n=1 Tax=Streptomyces sp. NPDC093795 TaxID=3366051 RepID=UPI00382BCAE8
MTYPQSNAALPASPVPFEIPVDAPRSGVIHVRYRHADRFTVVGNHLAQHPRLSAVAIGLAVYIQSLPDGADVTVKALTLRFREGEVTVRRALNELVAEGYVERRRLALGGGRFATRTVAYDRPGHGGRGSRTPAAQPERPAPAPPGPTPPPATRPAPEASAPAPLHGSAADVLVRLRTVDSRLLLSWRDVQRLVPAVEQWLGRDATPAQVVRTLTAALPPAHVPIHHPCRFVEFRLSALLPPPPAAVPPASGTDGPAPLVNCDGCDRAFRSHDPEAGCAGCRSAA